MTNLAYHTLIVASNEPEIIRKALVDRYCALDKNASACAKEYNTKRQTVTKWVIRYENEGENTKRNNNVQSTKRHSMHYGTGR